MTREEGLARLNIKPATLYSYVSRGLIGTAPHDDGRRSLYVRADVERVGSRKRGRMPKAASAESTMRWGEPVLASAITHITPQGPLYRNRSAVEMAKAGSSFDSVSQLLMTGIWQDGATACGQHDARERDQLGNDLLLDVPKGRLAFAIEEVADRAAEIALDLVIDIHKRQLAHARQLSPDRGFSTTGHADEGDQIRPGATCFS